MSILTKLISLIAATVAGLIVALVLVGYFLISSFGEKNVQNTLIANQKVAQAQLDATTQSFLLAGNMLAGNPDFARAVLHNETASIQAFAQKLTNEPNIDFVTITDKNGMVVGRGHSDKVGDSVGSGRSSIRIPLKGQQVIGVEPGNIVKLTLGAGVPIRYNGEIIGAMTLGMDMTSGAFVNYIKDQLGVECTVFDDDVRVSTTVLNAEKKPAVGTSLNNETIHNAVINKSETVISRNTILGSEYSTAYWPLKGFDGSNTGMLFIGMPRQDIEAAQFDTILYMVIAGVLLGLVMTVIGFMVSRAIVSPLRRATKYAEEVSHGNFNVTLEVASKDEVGTLAGALRNMVSTINANLSEVERGKKEAEAQAKAAQLATEKAEQSANEIEAKSEEMLEIAVAIEDVGRALSDAVAGLSGQIDQATSGAELQQSRVSETSVSMAEVNQATHEVAHMAAEASNSSGEARNQALEGAKMVDEVVKSIRNVEERTDELKKAMATLGEQAKGIDQVMNVINDVADQTNLLALNAAIEAARAGEAGRGFAVVADEVRKLAEKTMEATKEVGSAISGIQAGVGNSIRVVDSTADLITHTTDLSISSGDALNKIVEMISTASDQIQSIAAAAEEQSASSESINQNFGEVADISNQTAQVMEQSAVAVNNLAKQEITLNSLIVRLKE